VSKREVKEIEGSSCETNQEKHDDPEPSQHHNVHVCSHWSLPNTRRRGSKAHLSDRRVICIKLGANFFGFRRFPNDINGVVYATSSGA